MNQYQIIVQLRNITGHSLRLGLLEEIASCDFSEHSINVLVNRAEARSSRNGLTVTKRGVELFAFTETSPGVWVRLTSVPVVWWSTDEMHTSRPARTPDREWEDMCHRPGSSNFPMDNLDRRMQKQTGGL